MSNQVWLATADTNRIHDTDVFNSSEGAKMWLQELIAKYNPDMVSEQWFTYETGGVCRKWTSEFVYELREVKP